MEEKNSRNWIYLVILALVLATFVLVVFLPHRWQGEESGAQTVVIAVPYAESVQDYGTNYYTGWLEKRTGYHISFVYLEEGYERESVNMMLNSDDSGIDGIFLPQNQNIMSYEEYRDYIADARIVAPQEYLTGESCLQGLRQRCPDTDFEALVGEDGRFYCFPSLNMARTGQNMQILWINIDWLTRLDLTMPRTEEEFAQVLRAFRENDANGNGKRDELPLVSCESETAFQSYRYLLNAFAYYDGTRLPGNGESGKELAAFREGLSYCAMLYGEGLLTADAFSYTDRQFMELVNDPADTVGAFASHSIADVVYTNNPGVLAHYVQLAPLASAYCERGYAVRTEVLPSIGGLIPVNATHGEAAARIMDLMLSEEASLIALYGEEGVDWRFSRDGELSTYGTRAQVTTIRYLKGERQNKNYAGAGPMIAAAEYADGVTWNGDHSMSEYIDARAVKTYEAYYAPGKDDSFSGTAAGGTNEIAAYLGEEIPKFVTGERDVQSDRDWEQFLADYRRLVGT